MTSFTRKRLEKKRMHEKKRERERKLLRKMGGLQLRNGVVTNDDWLDRKRIIRQDVIEAEEQAQARSKARDEFISEK